MAKKKISVKVPADFLDNVVKAIDKSPEMQELEQKYRDYFDMENIDRIKNQITDGNFSKAWREYRKTADAADAEITKAAAKAEKATDPTASEKVEIVSQAIKKAQMKVLPLLDEAQIAVPANASNSFLYIQPIADAYRKGLDGSPIEADLFRVPAIDLLKTADIIKIVDTAEADGTEAAAGLLAKMLVKEYHNRQKKKEAENQNAITTINNSLLFITDKDLQDVFLTSTRKAGLFRFVDGQKKELALDVSTTFLNGLAKAYSDAYKEGRNIEGEIPIYFPSIAREMHIDLHHSDMKDKNKDRKEGREAYITRNFLTDIDGIYGIIPGDTTEYKMMSVHSYNPDTEIFTVQSPFLRRIIKVLDAKQEENLRLKKNYNSGTCDFLLKASAVSCRNQAAIEMLTRVLTGLIQRGTRTPDKKQTTSGEKVFSWSMDCKTLIKECPKIREAIKSKKTTREKTYTMQRAFKTMYEGFKKYTRVYDYFENFTITEIMPTATALDGKITITHTGKKSTFNPL